MRMLAAIIPFALLLGACEQQKPQAQGGSAFTYAKLPSMPKAADGAGGSGCLGDTGPLPDGIWFGYVAGWTATSLDFDPACIYSGAEAAAEATKRGDESPPPNDFFVANDSKAVRKIPVAPGVPALRVTHDSSGSMSNQMTTYSDLVANPGSYSICPGEGCPVWVAVNGGAVTEVSMQYFP